MTLNTTLHKRLATIIAHTQDSAAGHSKLIAKCHDLLKESDFDEYFESFVVILENLMITMAKNPNIERIIDFVAKFTTSLTTQAKNNCSGNNRTNNTSSQQQQHQTSQNNDNTTIMNGTQATITDEIENTFLIKYINYLLENHKANSDAVRYRCCQMLAKLMTAINNEQFIDEDLFDSLCDAMLERLKDINSRVQVQAISAIYRLQDPNDRNCRVIQALIFLMTYDPHWQVRYQAISHIAFSKQTLPHIIDRVRDQHPNVRRKALLILSEKVLIKFISVEKRLFILNYSLKDDEAIVSETCWKKLLPSWLAFKENNIIKLLKALDVVEATELIELMLNKINEDESLETLCKDFGAINSESHVVDLDSLDAETAFYWRWLCEKCAKEKADDCLDIILPSLTEFCNYVKSVIQRFDLSDQDGTLVERRRLENLFAIKQLVKMFAHLDFSDMHGKKSFVNLCHELFTNRNCSFLFETIMSVYKLAVPSIQVRINNIVELISDLRDPSSAINVSANETQMQSAMTNQMVVDTPGTCIQRKINAQETLFKISELKFKRYKITDELESFSKDVRSVQKTVDINRLIVLRDELKVVEDEIGSLEAVLQENEQIQLIPNKLGDDQGDEHESMADRAEPTQETDVVYHCLELCVCLLEDVDLKVLAPQLQSLCEDFILPNVGSVDEDIRTIAVRALNLICILKVEIAQKFIPLFLEMVQRDRKNIVIEAFKSIINCIMAYSLNKLVGHGKNDQDAERHTTEAITRITSVMTTMLDDQDPEVYTMAVEGFCKLFMTGHLLSAKLFSKLLIMYYSPLTENDKKLRACLAYFLPQFSFLRSSNQLCVEQSFMTTIKCLMNAPADSYLSEIDINKITEILLHLTNPKNLLRKSNQHQVTNNTCHENIARSICSEIVDEENTFKLRTYLKILNQLDITDADYYKLKDLKEYAEEMVIHIQDRLQKKSAKKFEDTVESLLQKKPEYRASLNAVNGSQRCSETNTQQESQNDTERDSTCGVDSDMDSSEIMDIDFNRLNKKSKSKKGNETTLSTTRTQPRDRTVLANQTNKISEMNQTSSMSLRLSVSTTNPNETLNSSRRSANKTLTPHQANNTTETPRRMSARLLTMAEQTSGTKRSSTTTPTTSSRSKKRTNQNTTRAKSVSPSSSADYEPPSKRKSLHAQDSAKNNGKKTSKR